MFSIFLINNIDGLFIVSDVHSKACEALEADIASQIAMFDKRLKPLNEIIHFHGPDGVAFTSGEHVKMSAADNVAFNAGGDFSSGSMGNTAILAGEKIGLFARTGTLSLNASEGPVQIQAQNGEMHLSAEQKLSLISASDMLFAGKKKVTLIGGGSYLVIDAGKIEYGMDTTYTRKIKRSVTTGSATLPVKFPYLPGDGKYDLALNFFDGISPIPEAPYTIHFEGGSELAGVLDEQGSAPHKSVLFEAFIDSFRPLLPLLKDPLLHEELLPAHWAGQIARQLCINIYQRVAPGALYFQRFGGLNIT